MLRSGILLASMVVAVASAPQQCLNLLDANNPMRHVLSSMLPQSSPMDLSPPTSLPLSNYMTCLGSVNVSAIMGGLLGAVLTQPMCVRALTSAMSLQNLANLHPTGPERSSPPPPGRDTNDSHHWSPRNASDEWHRVLNFTNAQVLTVCSPLVDIVPCFTDVLMPYVMQFVSGTPCCSAALDQTRADFGLSLDQLVVQLVRALADVVCSVQTPGFDGLVNQSCAFSLGQSLVHAAVPGHRLLAAVAQLPTDQACAALVDNGPFTLTSQAVSPPIFTAPYVPTTCVKPLDALVSWVARWPLVLASPEMAQVLGAATCLNESRWNMTWRHHEQAANTTIHAPKCYHVANGFVATCKYSTALQLFTSTLPPVVTVPPVGTPTATPTSANVMAKSTASTFKPMLALAVLGIAPFFAP